MRSFRIIACTGICKVGYLKLGADILHINCWHSKTFYPHNFSTFPIIVNVIQHVVCEAISP